MDVAEWLRTLGLEQYTPAFRQNDIGADLLPSLSADNLKELGVTSVGHRVRLLGAIAALRPAPVAAASATLDAAPRTEPEAERRQITVMFCDLVGSTALASRLDPEDLREVIGSFQGRVTQTVGSFDGFVAKYMGDGVLVYFGYPHAHEADAEQALRAGLALIDAVGELHAPQRLQVRIGIATGLVVVGDLIGAGSAQEQAVVGETPNLAARLQALADPGTIVISEGTRRQIGSLFEIHDLGPQSLKGFAEPQRAWRVLSENRALGRFEALRSDATPLVGREEELELLLRRWAQAKMERGRVVLISAEPGVGKSRLAEALAERIAGEPHIRLRYFCSPHHQDSALYAVIAQTERAAGFAHEDSPAEKLAKLQALLLATALPREEVALIAELHSLPSADLSPPLDVTPQRKKERAFEALVRQIERLSRQQPVLMVFEDIHWIDPSSRELLDRAIERIASWPVLLVATFRPEFQPPWVGQPHVTMLALTRLDQHDTAAMVANIAVNAALAGHIIQEIAERADGVPLFVEELTKAVLESGAQVGASLSAAPYSIVSVPATLHASLMARLDRLGSAAKAVAQMSAAIGREFEHELLACIADLPEPQLRESLDRLRNSGLLFVRGTPPQLTYWFKHALVQDAAYATLLRGRRQELHRRIAEAMEARFPERLETQPGLLAHHFSEAGLMERAVDYWLKAGQQALASSAMAEAEALLRRGLGLLPSLPDGRRRREQELDLQTALGPILTAVQSPGATAVFDAFARARQLCDEMNRPEKLLLILSGQWLHQYIRGDLDQAQQHAVEIRQLGEMQPDLVTRFTACRASGTTCFFRGEFAAALDHLRNAVGLYHSGQRSLLAGPIAAVDPLVDVVAVLSSTLACCGQLEQARLRSEAALAEARNLALAHTLAFALRWACLVGWLARSHQVELRCADELLALSKERGFPAFRAIGLVHRGWCLATSAGAEEGIPLLTSGLAELRVAGVISQTPFVLAMLADAYRITGQMEVALEHVAEGERLAETTRARWVLVEAFRLRGELLRQKGDPAAAEASYRNAIALAQQQSAKLFELRASTSLARLWRDQRRFADAQALLAPIYGWFTEGIDAPDLKDAKVLLDELA